MQYSQKAVDAKQEAQEEYDTAAQALKDAEAALDEAKKAVVDAAAKRLEDAQGELEAAQQAASVVKEAVKIAQDEVDAQADKVKEAQNAVDAAKGELTDPDGYDAAKKAYDEAVANKEQALSDQDDAVEKLKAAQDELDAAKKSVSSAQDAVDKAEEAKRQTGLIVEDKQEAYDEAYGALQAASAGDTTVKESLEKLNAAKDALAAAQKDEAEAKGAYDAAESDVTEAQQKANKAASDYNAAKKLSDEKAEALKTATADRNAAYTNLESVKAENADAISTYETAAAAYEEAYSTYETARKAVVNLQPEYNNCKTALEDATDAYNAAKEAAIASNVDYAKGAAGFYKSIGATGAVNIVTKLTGVNSVNAEKYFNDQFDEDGNVIDASPLNLDNMKLSLEILKQLNELRSADKLHELEVDTNLMAFSQVATMWAQHYSSGGWGDTGSGVNGSNIHSIAHANNLGENASWNGVDGEAGVTQAMNQWYTQEKAIYDSDDAAAFRAELDRLYETDHVTINDERIPTKGNWNNCVYAISKYAEFEDIYHETGHYLNIINPSYQYMGAAYADSTDYTQWNTYEQTFDFSGNSSKFSDGQIYTVDQFVSKFNEYYDKVMGDSGNALASLESEMKNAQKKYDETNEALSKARKDRD